MMHINHNTLPGNDTTPYITDAGLETELIFHKGYDLPQFASFPLLDSEQGRADLREYYEHYLEIARKHHTGIILEAPTWRASREWATKLGYNQSQLQQLNKQAIEFLQSLRQSAQLDMPCVISGCIGPRHDGYNPRYIMSVSEAEQYHHEQISSLKLAGADMITALTMTSISEACGVVRAAAHNKIAVVISFTTETDGRLPSGELLQHAIEQVDQLTEAYPRYYMINCAHPTHFQSAIQESQPWVNRIAGIRANASCKSHAELDESTELDAGNPEQLAQQYSQLKSCLHNLRVIGGCCGTNHHHVSSMASLCFG